jgi:hypothetical protein
MLLRKQRDGFRAVLRDTPVCHIKSLTESETMFVSNVALTPPKIQLMFWNFVRDGSTASPTCLNLVSAPAPTGLQLNVSLLTID